MAILKHIASKNPNYGAALEYLIFKYDELRKTPILDQNGNRIMRDEFYLNGLNCEPYSFDAACQQLNREYQKNQNKNEIKSHHYIISFDPRDSTENCLTGKRAQELGLEYAKANFPGHQALVCTHMDGHNGSGNIHVHIVINSLRKLDVPQQPFMERPIDCKAGYKHHVTNEYLKHLQKSLMDLCQREFLHQVDLLSPSRTGVTEAEYWAQRRLDEKNRKSKRKVLRQTRQNFKHRNSLSGMPLPLLVRKQSRMKIFKTSYRMNMTFLSKHNVGVTAICRRNGTSSYRSVLWEKAAKENVWKDSLFRTPRRICGTRKTPY